MKKLLVFYALPCLVGMLAVTAPFLVGAVLLPVSAGAAGGFFISITLTVVIAVTVYKHFAFTKFFCCLPVTRGAIALTDVVLCGLYSAVVYGVLLLKGDLPAGVLNLGLGLAFVCFFELFFAVFARKIRRSSDMITWLVILGCSALGSIVPVGGFIAAEALSLALGSTVKFIAAGVLAALSVGAAVSAAAIAKRRGFYE